MKKRKSLASIFLSGIFKENPTFILVVGLCPTLAVTTSAINGMGMGLATLSVLLISNALISIFQKIIPSKIRIPVYVIIIATAVTVIGMAMEAYTPALYAALGIFVPLIVVNCLILARAEMFASKNNVFLSVVDALGMGLGFTLSLTLLGSIREILGNGSLFGHALFGAGFQPAIIMILPPGAFLTIGVLMAMINKVAAMKKK